MALYLKSPADIQAIIDGADYASINTATKTQIALHFEEMPASVVAAAFDVIVATLSTDQANFARALFTDAPTAGGGGTIGTGGGTTTTSGTLTDKTFTTNVAYPAAGESYTVSLDFIAAGAYAAADFEAVLTASDARLHITRDTNAQRDGHSTGWTMFVPVGAAQAPVGYGQTPVPLTLTALLSGQGWTDAVAAAAPTWTGPTLIDTDAGNPGGNPLVTSVGDGASGSLEALPTANRAAPDLCTFYNAATDEVQDWLLSDSTAATAADAAGNPAVQRPLDFDAANNPKVWFRKR